MKSNNIKAYGESNRQCESYQNEISAFTMSVNRIDFALGQGGELHSHMARANHHPDDHSHVADSKKIYFLVLNHEKYLYVIYN